MGKFIDAVMYDMESTHYWAKTCELNQAIPAPLEEKAMYSLYVLATLHRSSKEVVDFYKELYEETKDRVARGIAAIPNESYRIMTDSQPPWSFLELWKYLAEQHGAVSIGSLYTFGLEGIFVLLHLNRGCEGSSMAYRKTGWPSSRRDTRPSPLKEAWLMRGIPMKRGRSSGSMHLSIW